MNTEDKIKRDCCIYETLDDAWETTSVVELKQPCASSSGTKEYDDIVRKHREINMKAWWGVNDLTTGQQTDTQKVKERILWLVEDSFLHRLWGSLKQRFGHTN